MAQFVTRKSTSAGKAMTLRRKAVRSVKRATVDLDTDYLMADIQRVYADSVRRVSGVK